MKKMWLIVGTVAVLTTAMFVFAVSMGKFGVGISLMYTMCLLSFYMTIEIFSRCFVPEMVGRFGFLYLTLTIILDLLAYVLFFWGT